MKIYAQKVGYTYLITTKRLPPMEEITGGIYAEAGLKIVLKNRLGRDEGLENIGLTQHAIHNIGKALLEDTHDT